MDIQTQPSTEVVITRLGWRVYEVRVMSGRRVFDTSFNVKVSLLGRELRVSMLRGTPPLPEWWRKHAAEYFPHARVATWRCKTQDGFREERYALTPPSWWELAKRMLRAYYGVR